MRKLKLEEDMVVMAEELCSGLTIEEADKMIGSIENETEMAEIFSMVHNKAWWLAHDADYFDEGTEEYNQIIEKIDAWFLLTYKLQDMITAILEAEGIETSGKPGIKAVEPFMNRNGFVDGNGWWIKA